MIKPCTILHVSDLHHGKAYGFASPDVFLKKFETGLRNAKTDKGLKPDLIVATGDLTSIAEREEFGQAKTTLMRMLELAGLPDDRLIVCPGNHDVSWRETEIAYQQASNDRDQAASCASGKMNNFLRAFGGAKTSPHAISPFPESGPPEAAHSVHYFSEFGVLLISLNSCMRISHLPASHYGYIGEKQLNLVSQTIDAFEKENAPARGLYRIVLCHHPLLAPDDGDGSGMRDPIYFQSWIGQREIHLVLHGHQHYHGAAKISAPVGSAMVIGAGSASVQSDQRVDVPLSFNLLQIKPEAGGRTVSVFRADFRREKQAWEVLSASFVDTRHELVRLHLPKLFERSVQAVQKAADSTNTAALDVLAADMLDAVAEALVWAEQEELIEMVARQALADCHTIFAIDVCGPRAWVGTGAYRYLAPQVKRYLTANVVKGQWDLTISKPVGAAIQRSIARAMKFRGDDAEPILTESMTQFDNVAVLNWHARDKFRFQFARILLWSEDELRSPIAQAIAVIHNAFHVPLFYLPTPVRAERRDVDYIMFLGKRERLCLYGSRDDDYRTKNSSMSTIENIGNYQKHFRVLLNDPSLLLALDAIALSKAGVRLSAPAPATRAVHRKGSSRRRKQRHLKSSSRRSGGT
jgi:predicted MPP superfamily phosphohydrolase